MRHLLVVVLLLLGSITAARAQVSVSIGFNLAAYPQMVAVPGYPVYYAPQVNSNFFFYDGMYWVYQDDRWYASTWYNGPWDYVEPEFVPLFVLRVPVRYYRRPPVYFGGWQVDTAPRWGEHWGGPWEQQRQGWDQWNHNAVPAPAPLPVYQRQYSGNRYPHVEQQRVLQAQQYRYQPRDTVVQQRFDAQRAVSTTAAPPAAARAAEAAPAREGARNDARGGGAEPAAPRAAGNRAPARAAAQAAQPVAPLPPQQAAPKAEPPKAPTGVVQRETPPARAQGQNKRPAATPDPQQGAEPAKSPQPQAAMPREQAPARAQVQNRRPVAGPDPQHNAEPAKPQQVQPRAAPVAQQPQREGQRPTAAPDPQQNQDNERGRGEQRGGERGK